MTTTTHTHATQAEADEHLDATVRQLIREYRRIRAAGYYISVFAMGFTFSTLLGLITH